jgi:hypothetical protein
MYSALNSCPTVMKLEFPQQIFEKYPDIKFHESPSNGSGVVLCGHSHGRTDRHGEANNCFSQFCERTYK